MNMLRWMRDGFSLSDKDEAEIREGVKALRDKYSVKAEDVAASFAMFSIVCVVVKEMLVTKFMKSLGLNKVTLGFLDSSSVQIDAFDIMPMMVFCSLFGGLVLLLSYEAMLMKAESLSASICLKVVSFVLVPFFCIYFVLNYYGVDKVCSLFFLCSCLLFVSFLLSIKANVLLRHALVSSFLMFCIAIWLVRGIGGDHESSEQKHNDRQSGMVVIHQGENVFEARILAYQKDVIYLEQNGREIVVPLGSIQKIDCGIRE